MPAASIVSLDDSFLVCSSSIHHSSTQHELFREPMMHVDIELCVFDAIWNMHQRR